MDSEELLAQLADIHLPEPVSFWPPAPGWWILAVILLLLAAWATSKILLASRRSKIKARALSELKKCYSRYADNTDSDTGNLQLRYVNEVNSVFKRVALVHFPGTAVAGLGGPEWLDFIKKNGESSLLTEEISDALSHGRFKTKLDVDVDLMNDFANQWITSLYDTANSSEGSQPQAAKIEDNAH